MRFTEPKRPPRPAVPALNLNRADGAGPAGFARNTAVVLMMGDGHRLRWCGLNMAQTAVGSSAKPGPGGDFVGQGRATNGPPFAVSTATPAQNGEPITRDIRELVDQWLEGFAPNHGLLLKSYEGNSLVFCQRETSSENLRPELSLVTESGPPRLRCERDPVTGDVVLSWRGVNTAVLQERAALASGPAWADSALPVSTTNERSVVTLAPEWAARFYRLRSK